MPVFDFTKLALALKSKKKPAQESTPENAVTIGTNEEGGSVLWPAPSLETASNIAVACLGASGKGKSIVISNAIVSEFINEHRLKSDEKMRTAYTVIDPKGDIIKYSISSLVCNAPELLSDVVYLNPFEGGFPFNLTKLPVGKTPLDIRAWNLAQLVGTVSTGIGTQAHLGQGARQIDVLSNVILAALDTSFPNGSLLWSYDALSLQDGFSKLASVTDSDRAKQFLLSTRLNDELRISCASRMRTAFAMTEQLERLMCADSCLDFSSLCSPGKMILIDLGQPTGGMTTLTNFWANLLVRQIVDALMERESPYFGHHVRIVADEAQIIAATLDDVAERLLTTGRSRGLSLVTMSQGTTLINSASPTLLRVLLTNTPTKLIGRLAAEDSVLLSKEQAPSLGSDESVGQLRAKFSAAVCNLADRQFYYLFPGRGRLRFTSKQVDMEAWKKAETERSDEIETMKKRFAVSNKRERRVTLEDVAPTNPKRGRKPASTDKPRSPWG